jgi:Undecaprenyl-phosphate glucose phosphotransferase
VGNSAELDRDVGTAQVAEMHVATAHAAMPDTTSRSWSRRIAADVVGFLDVIGVIAGALVPAMVYGVQAGIAINMFQVVQLALLVSLFAYLCLRHFGQYDTSRLHDLPLMPLRIAAALTLAFFAVFGIGVPFMPGNPNFWMWYTVWAATSLTLILAFRMIAHHVLARMSQAGLFEARVAVYGSGRIAERLSDYLANPALSVRFAGAFDDRVTSERHERAAQPPTGNLEDLITLGRSGRVDQIIIALPAAADHRTADIARRLAQLPVSLHVCTHLASDLIDEIPAHGVSRIGPIGLIDVKTKPLSDWGRHLKAVEDIVIGTIALVCLAPLMALIALAVKLESPGPVLFKQRRHGLNRRVIEVMKFRSMHVQENGADVKQATRNDPRVTRLGRVLRATSLDELPQLINVLRGEMSLIGPRPHALVHDDHYGEMLEGYANRHQVKPGMTGWAQVNGFRGPTETPDKMQSRVDHDLYYIDHWSLWLDLRILAMTVFVGLRHKNAL